MRNSFTHAVLACLAALCVAAAARAATVTVEYELTGGTAVNGEFAGSVTAGKFKMIFQASGPNTILSGPATVETFTVRALAFSTAFQYVEQTIQLTLLAPLMGQGGPGSAFVGGGGSLSGYTILHCVPAGLCTSYGFVASVPELYPSFLFYPDAINGVSLQRASGAASGTFVTSFGFSVRGSLQFTGREVSRTFVPEPARRLFLPVALLALAALRGIRRPRRRTA